MNVYKTVIHRGKNFYSWILLPDNPYCLEYRIGERTDPKIGRIFVDTTLERARNHPHWSHGIVILECDSDLPTMAHQILSTVYVDYPHYIEEFWQGQSKMEYFHPMEPVYTVSYVIPRRIMEK